jgi:drug/metabolite transporter (DMT)-like permease
MLAVVLALGAAVSFGGSDYVGGRVSREAGQAVSVALSAEVIKAVLVISVVPFVSSQTPSGPSLAWAAVAGVSDGAGTMTLYLGLRYTTFSAASSVSAVSAAACSVLAGYLLGERPGLLSLTGMALTLPAIAGVSVGAHQMTARRPQVSEPTPATVIVTDGRDLAEDSRRNATGRTGLGVGLGLIAGVAFGLSLIGLNRAGSRTDLWPIGVAELAAVVTIAGTAAATGRLGLPPHGTRRLSALTGVLGTAGLFSYFLATHRGLLAVTVVIYSLYPAVTILLARVLSHERLTMVAIAGLGLAAASVGLIAASGVG